MSELVTDCPRCAANTITFDVEARQFIRQAGWQRLYEVFCICRNCGRSSVFILRQRGQADPLGTTSITPSGTLGLYYIVEGFISLKDMKKEQPPDHIPKEISAVFNEGATCLSVECFNAAGTMFRLCVDLATRAMLPKDGQSPDAQTRRNLAKRIKWLLDGHFLPEALRALSGCIREDGNDGAHAGTLTKDEADDLLDFTTLLLERIYTEPERLKLAEQRRNTRRAAAQKNTAKS